MLIWSEAHQFIERVHKEEFSEEMTDVLKKADEACNNYFVFTHPWDMEQCRHPVIFKNEVDWTHCFKGDSEWAYMLNRKRFMAEIGQAYVLSGDESYVHHWKRLFYEWVSANKEERIHPFTFRKIDTGIRLVNWLKGYSCIRTSVNWTEKDEIQFKDQVRLQAEYLFGSFSSFDFQSNWGFLETSGLVQAAFIMETDTKRRWLRTALYRLKKMIRLQIYKDGFQKEQSPMYHHEVLHCILEIIIVMKKNRIAVPDYLKDVANRMLTASYQIMKPNGHQPMLGDSDDTDIRGILALGASLFERNDLRALVVENRCPVEWLWYMGEEAIQSYAKLYECLPDNKSCFLPNAGIAVFRGGWERNSSYLLFDHGPMGQVNKGHGHDDHLHIEIMNGGKEFLIDGGRYTYCEQEEREYFKSSHRHNTVTVDNYSASQYVDTWKWDRAAKPIDQVHRSTSTYDFVQSGHTGYWALNDPVHVTRKIVCLPSYWIMFDCFYSKKPHNYTQHFHFSENIPVAYKESQGIITSDKSSLNMAILSAEHPDSVDLKKGMTSRHYNEISHHPHVELQYKEKRNFIATSLIYFDNTFTTKDVVLNPISVCHIDGSKRSKEEVVAYEIIYFQRKDLVICSLIGENSFVVKNDQYCGELILVTDVQTEKEAIHVIQ